ncbi:MAG: alpha-ketoglutarate-dependent dioxygenase AlkB [Geodermatophilaceae bacterium]
MSVQTVCLGLALAALPLHGPRTTPMVCAVAAVSGLAGPARPGGGAGGVRRHRAQAAAYRPDTALINFYDDGARMGMHQDKDERSRRAGGLAEHR